MPTMVKGNSFKTFPRGNSWWGFCSHFKLRWSTKTWGWGWDQSQEMCRRKKHLWCLHLYMFSVYVHLYIIFVSIFKSIYTFICTFICIRIFISWYQGKGYVWQHVFPLLMLERFSHFQKQHVQTRQLNATWDFSTICVPLRAHSTSFKTASWNRGFERCSVTKQNGICLPKLKIAPRPSAEVH